MDVKVVKVIKPKKEKVKTCLYYLTKTSPKYLNKSNKTSDNTLYSPFYSYLTYMKQEEWWYD